MSKIRVLILFILIISFFAVGRFFWGNLDYTGDREGYDGSSKDENFLYRTFDELCKENNVEPPIWDDTLARAARPLVENIADTAMDEKADLQNRQIADSLANCGSTDAAFRAHAANMLKISDARKIIIDQNLITEFQDGRYTHMGIAVASRLLPPMKYMLILLSRRSVLLDSVPKHIRPGESFIFSGDLLVDSKSLDILVADPSADIEKYPVTVNPDGSFSFELLFDKGKGEYTVEFQVNYDVGPEIAALFDLAVTESPVEENEATSGLETGGSTVAKTTFSAEQKLFYLINKIRAKKGKVRLTRAADLDKVARAYAKEMMVNNHVAHVDINGRDIADRVKKDGIDYRYVAENIAVNETVTDAHRNLMRSPAHALAILDNRFSEVGVGVVFKETGSEKSVYVVEIFLSRR